MGMKLLILMNDRQSSTFEPSRPSYPEVAYGDVMSKDSGVSEWLENIVRTHQVICMAINSGSTDYLPSINGGFVSSRASPSIPSQPRP